MSYQTKSLLIASFLYSHSEVKLEGVDKTDVDNIFFKFSPEKDAEKLVDAYYTDQEFNCNCKTVFESQKNLKDLIFEAKRQAN